MAMSHTFTVKATRSGRWWVLEEPTLGAVSQVRRLSEVSKEMLEPIAYLAGVPESSIVVETQVVLPDDVAARMGKAAALREESRRANSEAARVTRELVMQMREDDLTLEDIGLMLGVSKSRVAQLAAGKVTA